MRVFLSLALHLSAHGLQNGAETMSPFQQALSMAMTPATFAATMTEGAATMLEGSAETLRAMAEMVNGAVGRQSCASNPASCQAPFKCDSDSPAALPLAIATADGQPNYHRW